MAWSWQDLQKMARRIDHDIENQGRWHTLQLKMFARQLRQRLPGLQFHFDAPGASTDFAFVTISAPEGEWGELTVGRDLVNPDRPVYSFNGCGWLEIDNYYEFYTVDEFLGHLSRMRTQGGRRYTQAYPPPVTPSPWRSMTPNLLERVVTGKLFSATMFPGAVNDLLNQRELPEFADPWMQLYRRLEEAVPKPERIEITNLRREVYLRVYAITGSPDLAGDVSDDWGLIATALSIDYTDGRLSALGLEYAQGRFPRRSLHPSTAKLKGLIEGML